MAGAHRDGVPLGYAAPPCCHTRAVLGCAGHSSRGLLLYAEYPDMGWSGSRCADLSWCRTWCAAQTWAGGHTVGGARLTCAALRGA
eukprot:673014-Rhodomonas_salina.1